MADVLNIGIIGAGNRGVNCYGKMITARSDAKVAALADQNPERMKAALGSLTAGVRLYTSAEELIRAEKLDGLVITSPDYHHADHVVAALEAGLRHILVEKPIATTAAGCTRILDAMEASPAHITIGFNLRHAPIARKVKEIIDSGLIGGLMIIENREFYDGGRTYMARWNRRYEWSGGLWIHKGSHDFDVFNWWNAAGNPMRVSAFAGINALRPEGIPFAIEPDKPVGPNCTACAYADTCPDFSPPVAGTRLFNAETAQEDGYLQDLCIYLSDKNTHDNGIAMVEYDNNVRASHMECFVCNFTDRFYTIIGDRGTLIFRLEDPTHIELRPRWGKDEIIDVPPAPEGGHGGADVLLVENFIENIRVGAPTASTMRDGIRAVVVGQAAELSWREHRMVSIDELIDLNLPSLARPAIPNHASIRNNP